MRRQRKRPMSEINVVPYIDVMLVLLVIFMITTPLLTQGVHVNLPKATSKTLSAKDTLPIVVSVDQQGRYFLNISAHPKQALFPSALANQVAIALQRAHNRNVYVKGDKNVDYGKVVQAMALLQKAGAKEVGLVTQALS